MKTLNFKVTGQKLIWDNKNEFLVDKSKKYLAVSFEFVDDEWTNAVKSVVFSVRGKNYMLALDENESAIIPDLCNIVGSFLVSAYGVNGEEEITTNSVFIKMLESVGADGEVPPEPDNTCYQKVLSIAQSVRDDADKGLFKGDKGDTGEQGQKGDTGEQGVQGPQGTQGPAGTYIAGRNINITDEKISAIPQLIPFVVPADLSLNTTPINLANIFSNGTGTYIVTGYDNTASTSVEIDTDIVELYVGTIISYVAESSLNILSGDWTYCTYYDEDNSTWNGGYTLTKIDASKIGCIDIQTALLVNSTTQIKDLPNGIYFLNCGQSTINLGVHSTNPKQTKTFTTGTIFIINHTDDTMLTIPPNFEVLKWTLSTGATTKNSTTLSIESLFTTLKTFLTTLSSADSFATINTAAQQCLTALEGGE